MATRHDARPRALARLGDRLLWLGFAIVIAVCGAGLVLTLDHPENDAGRPELTERGDAIVGPRLAALSPQLARLSMDIDAVSQQARTVYGHVRGRDTSAIRADLLAGQSLDQQAANDLAPIDVLRGTLLEGTSEDAISQANRAQIDRIDRATDAVTGLDGIWASIDSAATRVASLVDALAQHDAAVLDVTSRARSADYAGALQGLTVVEGALEQARTIADAADTAKLDTTTLRALIDRDAAYDSALQDLYSVLAANGGVMTDSAQGAYQRVLQAQAELPNNDTAMTVIVSDLGGQQVTLGLIALDQLRGTVSDAAPPPLSTASPG